ncbi:uncharacterized protein SAPINGB_P006127 [Magnusiomyces paraingens]|uniref:Anaphase-promoting complex subunit 1 N-terminal domain-containing protein n=1 Tax=Magnusiomyces paraingens TaxID=2606893 RepID=A0A5E8C5D4_9ASCO|nr:uncharacterized protein SAPINGB_P006127 [Saprochaete ingens]VVT58280.1 unnamed protein product [Saprochaete ingens]
MLRANSQQDSIPGNQLTMGPNSTVLWSRNGVLMRKFSFPDTPQESIRAVFVAFQQHPVRGGANAQPESVDAIAILAANYLHAYYLRGDFHIVSIPFVVASITASPHGLVLSRNFDAPGTLAEDDGHSPKLHLMSNPLLELEPIYTSSLTTICLSEEPVYFGGVSEIPFVVTFDPVRRQVNIYYLRYHHNSPPTPHTFDESIRNHSKLNKSTSSASSHLMLTSVSSFSLYTSLDHLYVEACTLNQETAIIVSNSLSNTINIMLFSTLENPSFAIPALSKSFEIPGSSPLLLTDISNKTRILAVLNQPNNIYLFDPFLSIKSIPIQLPSHWGNITQIGFYSYTSSNLIYAFSDKFYNINLPIVPSDDLSVKIFQGLYKLVDLRVFRTLSFAWTVLLNAITLSNWEALVASLVCQLYPASRLKEFTEQFKNYQIDTMTLDEILPTALKIAESFDDKISPELCPHVINLLHYIREELRLGYTSSGSLSQIDKFLMYLAHWSGWNDSWKSYYGFAPTAPQLTIEEYSHPFSEPPNILKCLASEPSTAYFPRLSEIYSDPSLDDLTPLSVVTLRFFNLLTQDSVENFLSVKLSKKILNDLSGGIQHVIFEYLSENSQELVKLDDTELWDILGRDDLLFSTLTPEMSQLGTNKDAMPKYTSALISTVGDLEFLSAWDEQTESDRTKISRLIFSTDRRFYEVSRILQSSKPKPIIVIQTPNMSELDLLNKQEETYILSVLKTCTVPIGRAAFYYSARKPLVTEKFPIPKLNFSAIVKPRDITMTLNKSLVSEENLSWGYFHNGIASGLSLVKDTITVNGNWIAFNKPTHLNSQHAGFLLGIGLNGHLKNLEEWHIYNYLGPKHSHTSIALLIGMAASNLRSMDTKLTKVLSVHIFALLPPGSSDLNVSVEVQTAGVVGMGLLYLESSHRRMTETFLGELEGRTRVHTEESIRIHTNESYKLATGIALGLINLGKGNDLKGLNDVKIVERLMQKAIAPRDVQTSQLEISMPGTIAALLLIFLRTNNFEIAKKLAPPENQEAYDYIRPDLLLIRTLAYHVIMWDQIGSNAEWIQENIPKAVLLTTSETNSNYSTDTISYYYIKAGLCMAMTFKYASTGNTSVRDCIVHFLDVVCKLTEHNVTQHDQLLAKQALLHIQNSLCLSLSIVMSGTGDLEALRRFRRLCLKTRKDTCGVNIATHLALGILFLGGGQFRFGNDNFALAALFISVYPVFPRVLVDNTSYLQPLRYFWALAAKPNCVVVREVETGHPCVVNLQIEYKSGKIVVQEAPCAIPNIENVLQISTVSDSYSPVQLDLASAPESPLTKAFLKTLTVYVSRRSTIINKATDIFQQNGNKYKSSTSNNPLGSGATGPPTQQHGGSSLASVLSKVKILADIDLERFTQSNTSLLHRAFETSKQDLMFANMSAARSPRSNEDLWNMRLIFAYQEYLQSGNGDPETNLKVDEMKTLLWKWKCERQKSNS